MDRKLRRYWISAIIIFALHNAEEVFRGLPDWAVEHPQFPTTLSTTSFTWATILLTLGVGVTAYILTQKSPQWSKTFLVGFCIVMIVNMLSHITFSLLTQTLMPGVITAVVLVIPVYGWLIYQVLNRKK